MKKNIFIALFYCFPWSLAAQNVPIRDTLEMNGDSVVISATRTARSLSNVTVPVTIVNAKAIQEIGSLRLTDILKEQTGLTMTSGFGAGIQLQGLNPDYAIILVNGEPLVGRTAGVLDLNRIALGNVQKIEIVKGPSSSLYGSEAMAGVINIITENTSKIPVDLSIRYGTNNTSDFTMNNYFSKKQVQYQGFYNFYQTDGYSIRPNSNSRYISPIDRFSSTQQIKYLFNDQTNLQINARYAKEKVVNEIAVQNNGITINSYGEENNKDLNISSTLSHRFTNKVKTSLRGYFTTYNAVQNLQTISGLPYNDLLDHNFKRIENQTDWKLNDKLFAVFGAGAVWEGIKSSRYENNLLRKQNNNQYAFTQWEYTPYQKLTLIGGFRFDQNAKFAAAFSPKFSFLYKLNNAHQLRFSIGKGFKAPDFRQLFLNFTNTAAGSYSVFGSIQAVDAITQLNQLGQIGNLFTNFYQLKLLNPEYANGMHLTWNWKINLKSNISVQLFRNDIKNLIETQQIGTYINGSPIFSYLNIGSAYTMGSELEATHKLNTQWMISGGYQLLYSGDKDQLKAIKSGTVFTKNEQGFSRLLQTNEYVGLPNTSRHKFQTKINYNGINGLFFNLRLIYRSKWAVINNNGNAVFDDGDIFANGYLNVNTVLGKNFKNGFVFQFGVDNIGNYIDPINLPNLPGRVFFTSLRYQFKNKN